MKSFLATAVAVLCLACSALAATYEYGAREGKLKPTQFLRSFQGFVNEFYRNKDAYKLEYHVGDSARFEERTASGEVLGTFAFVAPEGDEYEFKYEADDEGFKIEGEALPEAPEETDDVKAAREAFFEAYEKQVELVGSSEYEYDDDDDDDDDDDEESDESSEELYSSEEDSDESDEDDSDEDEEDEDEEKSTFRGFNSRSQSSDRRRVQNQRVPSYFSIPYGRRS